MKLKIIILANIITIIVCLILSGLYFVSNPGGFYLKADGFLPSFEYTSEMLNYEEIHNASFNGPVTINTTDRSIELCTYSEASYPKDLVMGNHQNLETIQFSIEEINHMSTITIDGVVYSISQGIIDEIDIVDTYSTTSFNFAGSSVEELASTTFYYLPDNPTYLYTTNYLDMINNMTAQFYLEGFFDVSNSAENGLTINMTPEIANSNKVEYISIVVPFQIDGSCSMIEPNSTYIIDNTGGHYE